jgi:predicted permease
VLPASFDAPLVWGQSEFLLPLVGEPSYRTRRTGGFMRCIGRLTPDVSREQAQSELAAIAARLARDYPKENASAGLRLTDLHDSNFQGPYRLLPWLMTGVSLTMLLLACGNLASLQLARALHRMRDFAVRTALGGTRRQLILPWLCENLVLAVIGGTGGLLVATWTNDVVTRLLGDALPLGPIPVDARVVGFAIAVSVASGMVCGLAPAWLCTRASTIDALKATSATSTSNVLQRNLKRALTAGTLALAVALLGVAGSFGVALQAFMQRAIGWQPEGLFSTRIALPGNRYPDPVRQLEFQRVLLDRLAALPGVERAALAYSLPFYSLDMMGRTASLVVEGQPEPPPGREPAVEATAVSADYFTTLRMPLRAGTLFPPDLKPEDPPVVVINQALAQQFWPGQDPVGRRVRFLETANPLRDTTAWLRVIGVVDDVRMLVRLDAPPTRLQLYRPLAQYPSAYFAVVLRTSVLPDTMVRPVKQAVATLDPDLAIGYPSSVRGFAELILRNLDVVEFNFVISAALGLLIAGVGLFGVVSQLAAQRTRDIGIRMALGATRSDIMRVVLSEGVWLLVAGVTLGVPAFYALNGMLSRAVPEMSLPGPWLLAVNVLVLALTMLAATWLPARKATHINPVEALRAE